VWKQARKARQTLSREGPFVDQTDVADDTVDVKVTDGRVTAVGRSERGRDQAPLDRASHRASLKCTHARLTPSCTSVRRWYRQLARVIAVVPGIPKRHRKRRC